MTPSKPKHQCLFAFKVHEYQLLLGRERIHQVTNTIRIANIGWRIRICNREYTFFSVAINFIRQCSKFHTMIMLSNFINLIKTIIEINEFYNFLSSTSALKIYFLNINT